MKFCLQCALKKIPLFKTILKCPEAGPSVEEIMMRAKERSALRYHIWSQP